MLRLRSHAKINWHLEVLGRRSDGYHELRTLFQTIDLADEVVLERIASGIELEIAGGGRLAADPTNLAWRAAELFRERFGLAGGVRIRIEKRIPLGAGLGGGSSNAAAVIAGLARLYAIDLPPADLMAAGAELGADVPFFFAGGVALGTGRGDRIEPLEDSAVASRALRLAVPPFPVPTRDVFAAYVSGARRAVPESLARALAGALPRDLAELGGWNDLEPTCFQLFPGLAGVYNRLTTAGASQVRLSGSGGTIYALFANAQVAERAGLALPGDFSWMTARTLGRNEWRDSAGF
jgi:4-diphosphocytidyl-2-C-methyl-D-erythritol kinase